MSEKPDGASDWVVLGTARGDVGQVRRHIMQVLDTYDVVVEEFTTEVSDDDPIHVRVYAEDPEIRKNALAALESPPKETAS